MSERWQLAKDTTGREDQAGMQTQGEWLCGSSRVTPSPSAHPCPVGAALAACWLVPAGSGAGEI